MSYRRKAASTGGKPPRPVKRTKTELAEELVSTPDKVVPSLDLKVSIDEDPSDPNNVDDANVDRSQSEANRTLAGDDEEELTPVPTEPNTPIMSPKKAKTQTILPSPTGIITTLTRDYFTKPLVTRLNKMVVHEDAKNNCFALNRLPTGLRWGSGIGGVKEHADYLCYQGEPVQVWMVGEIESWHYKEWVKGGSSDVGAFGGAARKPSITILPLLSADEEHAKDLIMHLSNPFQAPDALQDGGIIASRFMASADTDPKNIDQFDSIYDATQQGKELNPIDASLLKEYDVVLVVAFLHRYYLYDANEVRKAEDLVTTEHQQRGTTFKHRIRFVDKSAIGYKRKYWRANWELDTIYHVFSAPQSARYKKSVSNGSSMPL